MPPNGLQLWRHTRILSISNLAVADIDVVLMMPALELIWVEKSEIASRVRGRIESVLDWVKVRGYQEGGNPARWKGNLDQLLPTRSKVRNIKHHAALPYMEISEFIHRLREQDGTSARVIEFLILTASRTSEVLNATWAEINLEQQVWTIPQERMKNGRERPLFPGQRIKKPLSNMAFSMLLLRMSRADITAHGFRSKFRDWTAEQTAFPHEVAEMALAHTISNKAEAAYRRGDLFEKRRKLMGAWSIFCGSQNAQGEVNGL